MTVHKRRRQLEVSILETKRMLGLVDDHPTMGPSFRKRVEMMKLELDILGYYISSHSISNHSQLLKGVVDDKAGFSIETGNARTALSNSDVLAAYQRVSETRTELQDVEISGTLKGILLESWKFDFLAETGETITGAIGPVLSEEEAAHIFSEFFNRKCTAMFQKTSVYLRRGRVKEIFVLLGVKG